jgi:hypothetical protein
MGVICTLMIKIFGFSVEGSIWKRILPLFISIFIGIGAYIGSAHLFKVQEMRELWTLIREKLSSRKQKAESR